MNLKKMSLSLIVLSAFSSLTSLACITPPMKVGNTRIYVTARTLELKSLVRGEPAEMFISTQSTNKVAGSFSLVEGNVTYNYKFQLLKSAPNKTNGTVDYETFIERQKGSDASTSQFIFVREKFDPRAPIPRSTMPDISAEKEKLEFDHYYSKYGCRFEQVFFPASR